MANKHKGNGFTKAAQGNQKAGEAKAADRKAAEQDARNRKAAERRQREISRQREQELARIASIRSAMTAFDQSSTDYTSLIGGVNKTYGIRMTKEVGDITHFGEVVMEVIMTEKDYPAIMVVASNFEPIATSELFFLPIFCLRQETMKYIGQGQLCFEWQQELHAALRSKLWDFIFAPTKPTAPTQPMAQAPRLTSRLVNVSASKSVARRIDQFDLAKSVQLTRQVLTARLKQDGVGGICHIGDGLSHIYFLRERVAGAQKITFLEGGNIELLTAIEEHHPQGVDVDVKSVIDAFASNVNSVDVNDLRNARQHVTSWLSRYFGFVQRAEGIEAGTQVKLSA